MTTAILDRPRYGELLFILVIGALQPATEFFLGRPAASVYNIIAAIIVIAYVIVRLVRNRGQLKAWGIRLDTFRESMPLHFSFALAAAMPLLLYGWYREVLPLPRSFWLLLVLYPIWGVAQQFALQNFVARNLRGLFPNALLRSCATATLFALSHAPSVQLTLLAFCAGVFFTLLYEKRPNLLTLGIAHGIIGPLVFYLVLQQDQWQVLTEHLLP